MPTCWQEVLESRVGLVTGQRLGVALALWAMLAALETGSSMTLKLALALGIALAVIDGQAVHAVSVRPSPLASSRTPST